MKRKIISILLTLVLVLSFSLVTAVPAAAVTPYTPTIDGIISSGEWDGAVEIPVASGMGTVKLLASTGYLYVLFDLVDSTDARLGENLKGNDQISINVNPTDGGSWGFPYDLIFETSADLPWNPKDNSGIIDGWNTRWFPNNAQEPLPVDLESATKYSGGKRITEWKLPLATIVPSPGDTLKVGGAIEVGDGSSYVYPIDLDWSTVSTFAEYSYRVNNQDTGLYYQSIQAAIDAANPNDTIFVAAGTYNEQVVIDKQLTLNAANAGVNAVTETRGSESIIDGGDTTALTISADGVIIDGFTLDGGVTLDDSENPISGGTLSSNIITGADSDVEPIKAQNGIRLGWDDGVGVDGFTIENNTIINSKQKGIRFANTKLANGGPQHTSNITISGNEIKDNGSAGIETYGPGYNTIINNIISGNIGNGINLKFDDGDVVTGNIITNNTKGGIILREITNTIVENNSISGHLDVERGGIWVREGSIGNTISYNDITGNYNGILVSRKKTDVDPPSGNSITDNNISGNINYGILNTLVDPPTSVNAANNWWGTTDLNEIALKVSENVDYAPCLTARVPMTLYVPAPYATIQEAINAANTGDTVIVAAGTYDEDVTIDKSLTLISAAGKDNTTINGQLGGWAAAVGVADGVSNVVIGDTGQGFTINAAGIAAIYIVGSGIGNQDITIRDNKLVAAGAGQNALLTGGGQLNITVDKNELISAYAPGQVLYINGEVSLGAANASSNVDITNNTFKGHMGGGVLLATEASGNIFGNDFTESSSTYARLELWVSGADVTDNIFEDTPPGTVQVLDGSGTLNMATVAEDNTFDRAVVIEGGNVIFSSIQDAIATASDGDTINVAAGTYNEAVLIDNKPLTLLGANYDVNPVTHLGERGDESIIDGTGIATTLFGNIVQIKGGANAAEPLEGVVVFSGFTVKNSPGSGIEARYSPNDVYENNILTNNKGSVIFLREGGDGTVIRNNVISTHAGGSGLYVIQLQVMGDDNIVENNAISGDGMAQIILWNVGDDNIVEGNTITGIGLAEYTYGLTLGIWLTGAGSGNIIRGNTVAPEEGGLGFDIAIDVVIASNTLVEDNIVHNNVVGVKVTQGADTTFVKGNDIQGNEDGILVTSTAIDTTIEGNTIEFNTNTGILNSGSETGNEAHFNNIVGNATGLNNTATAEFDATNNWWGIKASGLIKKMVSGNVDYDPWIGAKTKDSKSKKTAEGADIVEAKDKTDTDVLKKGKGKPTITVTEFTDNPGDGAPGGFTSVGKYIDVHIDDITEVDEIEIRNYYTLADIDGLVEATLKLSWWNGTAWIECSDSGAIYPEGGPTYRGYVWAIIKDTGTTPTLDDLAGTPFMPMGTPPTSPSIVTSAASSVTTRRATLNGNLASLGTALSVDVSFEWGRTTAYGRVTTTQTMISTDLFSFSLSGLSPGTTYHFRAKAVGDGTSYGADTVFTTLTTPPGVTTNDATSVTTTSAGLNGRLYSLGTASLVAVSFEWGETTDYGNTATVTASPLSQTDYFNVSLSGLIRGTTYHFRVKAVGDGTRYGADRDFTTLTTPPVVTIDAVTTPTNAATQTLSGTMEEGTTVALTADTAVTFREVGYTTAITWSCEVTLVEGSNEITATATDASGNEGTATTTIVLDTIAPTVVSVSPATDATGVAITTMVTATFSEAIDEATLAFTLDGVAGSVTYTGTTATFTPNANLGYGTIYTASIQASDLAGNPMAEAHTWSFTTMIAPDTTPPTVVSVSPAADAAGVAITTMVTATFSEAIDEATLAFTLDGVAGSVTYTGTTATFTPSANLRYSTIYTASIQASDLAGNPMAEAHTWSFTTRAEPAPAAPAAPPAPPPGTTDVRGMVTTAGVFLEPVTATSDDELCTLTIPEGTVGLTEELEPIDEITVVVMDEPPPPPEDAHVVGLTYDLGPDGATFDPPLTLTFSYDPDALPEGVPEEDLVLAYYDEDTGEWVELDGVVDTVNNTITASVPHFTTFAIIGVVPVVAPPEPARFTIRSLWVSPSEVTPDEEVNISVLVANTGGKLGSYSLALKINGVKGDEKRVTVAAGRSRIVSFSVTKEEADSYTVTVDGLSGSFTVVRVVAPSEPAAFSVSYLSVSPWLEVEPGETVTITVLVANTGDESGSYTVVLKIDGVKEAEKTVTVAAGRSRIVSFSVTKEEADSYTVTVDGLSGSFTVVRVVAPSEPAAFSVSYLSVSPWLEVEPGETVTITVLVANTGDESGSYTVVLKIDGVKEAEKTVTIAAGEGRDVSFNVTREEAGSYTAAVDGLSGSFTVVAPPEEEEEEVPAKPGINWPVLGGIIGGVMVVGLLIYFFVRRRAV